jgi:hypothetical protein
MPRTLTLAATITIPAGTIDLRLDNIDLDASTEDQRRTLDLLRLLIANPVIANPVIANPVSTKPQTAPGRPAAGRLALLRTIADHGGAWDGNIAALAIATPGAGSTAGARKQCAGQLARSPLVTVTRNGRNVTSITLTAAGRAVLDGDRDGTNTEPTLAAVPTPPPPAPAPVDDDEDDLDIDDDVDDLAWATSALGDQP